MSADETPGLPQPGEPVITACRGTLHYQLDTPTLVYRGRRVYFCMQACKQTFLDDPLRSCLAADLEQTTP